MESNPPPSTPSSTPPSTPSSAPRSTSPASPRSGPPATAPSSPPFRLNPLAIVFAAILCFLLEIGWYAYFRDPWLAGIGRTRDWLMNTGVNPALQYVTAIVALAVMAAVMSYFLQRTGRQTVLRGVWVAFWMWLGVAATILATQYAFEVRTWALYAINAGFWLVDMIVMGIIVGAWKTRIPR
jgi:hypothetical protein